MKFIITIIRRLILINELPRPLGRWKIEECNIRINKKIDLSNEDHCGPCGEYKLSKQFPQKIKVNEMFSNKNK